MSAKMVDRIAADMKNLQMEAPGTQTNSSGAHQSPPSLFDASKWISADIQKTFPDGYLIRPLNVHDYDRGYLDCLAQLTRVGDISKAEFEERFCFLQSRPGEYFTIVIEELATKKVVGSGTILVEKKFIRQLGLVGHIEDIVVHESQRGKNFGKKIIDQLTHIGKQAGCYKIILCCDEKNQGFYEKCGYAKKEVEMVLYFQQ